MGVWGEFIKRSWVLQEPKHPTDSCQVTPFSQPWRVGGRRGNSLSWTKIPELPRGGLRRQKPKAWPLLLHRGPESQHQEKQSGCFPSQQTSILCTLQFTPHICSVPRLVIRVPIPTAWADGSRGSHWWSPALPTTSHADGSPGSHRWSPVLPTTSHASAALPRSVLSVFSKWQSRS